MFKRKKKKTGYETPKLRKFTPPPPPKGRAYKLSNGDIFWLNDVGIQQTFQKSIKDLSLGEKIEPGFICIEKTKRRHWWQFWKPKYRGAKFMYVEKENKNECSNH